MANDKLSPIQQELLNRADSIFDSIKNAAIVAKDFAVEQLPDVAYQLIALERAYLTTLFLLPFIFITGLILLVMKHFKINKNRSGDTWAGFLAAPFAVVSVFSTIAMTFTFKAGRGGYRVSQKLKTVALASVVTFRTPKTP